MLVFLMMGRMVLLKPGDSTAGVGPKVGMVCSSLRPWDKKLTTVRTAIAMMHYQGGRRDTNFSLRWEFEAHRGCSRRLADGSNAGVLHIGTSGHCLFATIEAQHVSGTRV